MNDENESNEKCGKNLWNLLADRSVQIDDQFILKLTKDSKNVSKEVKNACKVFHFSSEWNLLEVLAKIDELDPKDYPQLFIFILDDSSFNFLEPKEATSEPAKKKFKNCDKMIEKFNKSLLKFDKSRPLIFEITSELQNKVELYYKDENKEEFIAINLNRKEINEVTIFEELLLSFLNGNLDSILMNNNFMQKIKHSKIIIKFLRTLKLHEKILTRMFLNLSKNCSKQEFQTFLDIPFNCEEIMLNNETILCQLSPHFDEPAINPNNQLPSSVLSIAVEHKNIELVNYLIVNWSHLIQQLPSDHQVNISTTAYNTNQLDVLCDLIKIADFPFPQSLNVDGNLTDQKFSKLILERKEFHTAIEEDDFEKLEKFISQYSRLKLVYSLDNESAVNHAIRSKKYKVYFYFVSAGFKKAIKIHPQNIVDRNEAEIIKKHILIQKAENINKALQDENKDIMLLYTRSCIHNKRINKNQEAEYRFKIRKWFEDINKLKFGPDLLKVAASCEDLKIIFNFESTTVYEMELKSDALGLTTKCNIFIGAMETDQNNEEFIKGVLTHELCHYALKLVYQNSFLPYYKHTPDICDIFNEIVKEFDQWSKDDFNNPDDECDKIISSVYTAYDSTKFGYELIVRVMQIFALYDDNQEKLEYLQDKYKRLFEFWETFVVPEFKNFNLKLRKEVEKLNQSDGILPQILKEAIDIDEFKNLFQIFETKISIVTTNFPKLLLVNIHKFTLEKYGKLACSRNIFVDSEKFDEKCFRINFKKILNDVPELTIFVDCSRKFSDNLRKVFVKMSFNFVFLMSNDEHLEELEGIIRTKSDQNPTKFNINYNWSDLTESSQNFLLKTKINFQNNPQLSLKDLLTPNDSQASNSDYSEIIDAQLLQNLIEKSKIEVNLTSKTDKNFEFLFEPRKFIQVKKKLESQKKILWKDLKDVPRVLSLNELLMLTKNKRYILISDIAGNGKSWAMKNAAKILREQNSTSWVTYVDLKQYIKEFEELDEEPDFSTFMIENILKFSQEYEEKIFQKLFNEGRVFILFDGFDEIAPKYADIVRELARSIEYNGGNQLWIATRDYFEVDIQKRLNIDVICKLDEFTELDGKKFIVKSWMLDDIKKKVINSKKEFEKFVKSSPYYSKYKEKAEKIITEILLRENLSVGLPQLFKIIADTNNKNSNIILSALQMYGKFLNKLYEKWACDKGQLRKDANTESLNYKLNFIKFHQFAAIISLFPEFVTFFFKFDGSEWSDEEVIACGIMSKKDGKFYFLHETFREYLAAEAIAEKLKMDENCQNVINLFVLILTVEKYAVIRMFLNDSIDPSTLVKISQKVKITQIYDTNSFHDIFAKSLENLANFVIKILKSGNYENVKKIMNENSWKIATKTKDSKLVWKYFDFVFEFLKIEDLAAFIDENRIFLALIGSTLDIEHFESFLEEIKSQIGLEFIKKGLKLTTNDELERNIFYFLCQASILNAEKIQKVLKILQNYLPVPEIINLMTKCNKNNQNVLQINIQVGSILNFESFWNVIKSLFQSQNSSEKFKEFAKHEDSQNRNILHEMACCSDAELHFVVWQLLINLFENKSDLKQMTAVKDINNNNFIHELVKNNNILEVLKWTVKTFEDNFNDAQYRDLILSNGQYNRNLIQSATAGCQRTVYIDELWTIILKSQKTDQNMLTLLEQVDERNQNILHIALQHSSNEIFNYFFDKLEKTSVKEMLSQIDSNGQNLLQIGAIHNKTLELHRDLWEIYKLHFNKSELIQFIHNKDNNGDNLLFVAIMSNSVEVVGFIWNQIKDVMEPDEFKAYMLLKRKNGDNLTEMAYDNWTHQRKIFSWVQSYVRKMGVNIKFGRKDRMAAFAHIYHKNAKITTTSGIIINT